MTYPSPEELAKEERARERQRTKGLSGYIQEAMGDAPAAPSEEKEGQTSQEPPEWFKFAAYILIFLFMIFIAVLLGKGVIWAWTL